MNHLTALLAFSAVMIVLATLTTVIVEALHGLTSRRAHDFQQLLQRLYEEAVEPRIGRLADTTAADFAAQITRNPAFAPDRQGLWFFRKSFTELTTRQFVEQFAQTEAGKALCAKAAGQTASATIGALAYEFERFGDAASDYFKRRAAALSVLVAFAMAITLNVDAISLYGALSADRSLAEKVITELDVEALEQTMAESIRNGADKDTVEQTYNDVLDRIRADASRLDATGLPIGHAYFPFCSGVTGAGAALPAPDARCTPDVPRAGFCTNMWILSSVCFALADVGRRVFGTSQGIGWLVSALISGGLIGLGAPFWFKTYQFIASFVPGVQLPDRTQARQPRTPPPAGAKPRKARASVTVPAGGPGDDALEGLGGGQAEAASAAVTVTSAHAMGLTEYDLYEAFANSLPAQPPPETP